MKTIIALEDFTGYPQGAKEGSKRHDFERGDELEVSEAFAELVIGKGHAKEKTAKAEVKEPVAPKPAAKKE